MPGDIPVFERLKIELGDSVKMKHYSASLYGAIQVFAGKEDFARGKSWPEWPGTVRN